MGSTIKIWSKKPIPRIWAINLLSLYHYSLHEISKLLPTYFNTIYISIQRCYAYLSISGILNEENSSTYVTSVQSISAKWRLMQYFPKCWEKEIYFFGVNLKGELIFFYNNCNEVTLKDFLWYRELLWEWDFWPELRHSHFNREIDRLNKSRKYI